jgi:hypothetical protein
MSSEELDKVRQSAITAANQDTVRFPVPFGVPFGVPIAGTNSFFSFRYSCTEISSEGGNLHVKTRETRYQDGKLTSEECEGMLDRNAYDNMVREAQNQFVNQVGSLMKLFFLPFSGK